MWVYRYTFTCVNKAGITFVGLMCTMYYWSCQSLLILECPQELTALFQPFSVCEDYINPIYFKQELSKCILRAMRFIHELSDDKLKDKEVGCVSDLLKAIKTLLVRCSLRELITTVDNLRLDTTIRMLNISHFNAKMNALKEVVRLTEEPFQV